MIDALIRRIFRLKFARNPEFWLNCVRRDAHGTAKFPERCMWPMGRRDPRNGVPSPEGVGKIKAGPAPNRAIGRFSKIKNSNAKRRIMLVLFQFLNVMSAFPRYVIIAISMKYR